MYIFTCIYIPVMSFSVIVWVRKTTLARMIKIMIVDSSCVVFNHYTSKTKAECF